MKKSIISLLVLLTIALLPTSCTLFDSDYLDDKYEAEEPVPVHTGEGYDRIVNVEEGTSKVSYQFNSNVRQLTDAHEPYILKVKMDSANTYGYVQFLPSIPDDLRPRKGEIIHSTGSEHFPDGIGHKVVMADYIDDTYTCVITMVPLQSIFQHLEMDVDPFENFEDATYENNTRAGNEEEVDIESGWRKKFHFSFDDFIPEMNIKASNNRMVSGYGSVKLKIGGEYSDSIHIKISLPHWWSPAIYISEVTETVVTLDISGALGFSKTFTVCGDLVKAVIGRPLNFHVGPVVIKLFFPFEIALDANINAAMHVRLTSIKHSSIDINPNTLKDGSSSSLRDTNKKKKMDGVKVEFTDDPGVLSHLSGSISVQPTIGLGIGFFTKGIGAQAKLALNLEGRAEMPKANSFDTFSTEGNPGLVFDPSLQAYVKVVLETDVSKMFNEIMDDFKDEIDAAIKAIDYVIDNNHTEAETHDEHQKRIKEAHDWVKDNYARTASESVDDEIEGDKGKFFKSFEWTWGPWTLFKLSDYGFDFRKTWAPRISFDKIYVERTSMQKDGEDIWWVSYFISDNGLITNVADFYQYVYVSVPSSDHELLYGIFPESKGMRIKGETTDKDLFIFHVPGLQRDVKYHIYALFSTTPIDTSNPKAAKIPTEGTVFMSKPVNYSYSIPKVSITSYEYFLTDWKENAEGKTVYEIEITTKAKMKGADSHLDTWGIIGNVYYPGTTTKYKDPEWISVWNAGDNLKDGTYTQTWKLRTTEKDLYIQMVPYVSVDGKQILLEKEARYEDIHINF